MSRRALALASVLALLCGLGACSSDPDSLVGSEFLEDILGSKPGVVFQDTIAVSGDTVLAYASLLTDEPGLLVGRRLGYTRSIVLRPDFSSASGDVGRTIQEASLRIRLRVKEQGDSSYVDARLHQLAERYSEGDSLETLNTLGVIIDPTSGLADRVITLGEYNQPLPIDLVEGWIRGDSANNGIAIVYQGASDSWLARFDASEITGTDVTPPTIKVTFADGDRFYPIKHDAVFVRPTDATSNLVISDGFVRRVFFRVDLDQLSDSSAVHSARIIFNLVPGTGSGFETAELYIPDSDDPTTRGFLSGTPVNSVLFDDGDEALGFTVTNTLLGILNGSLPDNGFVMRYVGERTRLRFQEFYTSSAVDSLAPRMILTSSTPADFNP